jgi:GNAT superfamily N-acetyltransferase
VNEDSAVEAGDVDDPFIVVAELDVAKYRSAILGLLGEIYPAVPQETLGDRFDVIENSGWRCAGVSVHGELIALSGFWVQTRFYCGRYLYVDHFVVTSARRLQQIGQRLLAFLHELAVAEGCELTCLDTFVTNTRAQDFWLREGYQWVGKHFTRPITAGSVA